MKLNFWKKKQKEIKTPLPKKQATTPRAPSEQISGEDVIKQQNVRMINRQLYEREESEELKKRTSSLEQLGSQWSPKVRSKKVSSIGESDLVNVIEERTKRRNMILRWAGIVGAGLLVLGLAIAVTVGYRSLRQVDEDQMRIELVGPGEFTAGEEITYTITYGNNSFVGWKNVELTFKPPQGFRFRSSVPQFRKEGRQYITTIGDLAPGEVGEATVRGQLLGELNETALAEVEFAISPNNFEKARYTKVATSPTTIVAMPLEISVDAANNAAEGERMIAVIKIINTSSIALENVLLRINAPPGTQLAAEDFEFSREFSVKDAAWTIPTIEPLAEISRSAVLYVEGQPGERRAIEVQGLVKEENQIYLLRQISHVVTISSSELAVSQTFNESAEQPTVVAGQRMLGAVTYQNVGTTGLKNVIVSVKFEGTGVDPATIELPKGGAYDPIGRTITWTAASEPLLGTVLPQQKGELKYMFSMLPTEELPSTTDTKNSILIVTATIDSPDLETPPGQPRKVISDRFELPITTNLTLDIDSYYDDGRLGLPSTGPLPPRVGEQTTYTIRFRLGSSLNDVGEARMRAVLPDGVKYMDQMYKTAGEFDFNERNGEVVWTVPLVEGLTGRRTPAPELHVQVGITPGENLRRKVVPLLQSASATALDLFTDVNVTADAHEKSLPTTQTASSQNGQVQ